MDSGQYGFDTGPSFDASEKQSLHQPANVTISSAKDAAEGQHKPDIQMENPQPPVSSADALILLQAFQSLSSKTSRQSPNARQIQYFLDESKRRESCRSQGNREATRPAPKKQRRETAAKSGTSGKARGLIRLSTVLLFLFLGFVIYVLHVAVVHGAIRKYQEELERTSRYLSECNMELRASREAWSSLRVEVQALLAEEALTKQDPLFRWFGRSLFRRFG